MWNKAAIGERETGELVARIRCRLLPADCARSFDDARLFDAPAAAKLYRELVAPVEAGLGDASLVYAVTSGALGSIPLGVLISEPGAEQAVAGEGAELAALAEAKWLGDRFALATLPSVSSLRAFDRAAAGAPGVPLAGVGDPTLGPPIGDERKVRSARVSASRSGSGLADVFALRRLPSLPGTRRELLALAETLGAGDTALLMGGAASEGAVKRWSQLNEARVVAFATHAALPSEVDGLAEPGLVLTPPPAASPIDDGYLSASEAAGLHLSADMVILSACNTAGPDGRSRGESLSGLARAFLFAGARSMLVSHWVVSDEVGPAITGEMFRILAARPATARAEALRLALRGVRSGTSELGGPVAGWKANWADPWAWAPFVLVESGS